MKLKEQMMRLYILQVDGCMEMWIAGKYENGGKIPGGGAGGGLEKYEWSTEEGRLEFLKWWKWKGIPSDNIVELMRVCCIENGDVGGSWRV